MKCTMVFSSSAAALPGRREWAGGQPAVAPTLGIILVYDRGCNVIDWSKQRSLDRQTWPEKALVRSQ